MLVSCHDDTLDRVSDGHGKIYEKTYAELAGLDFGVKHGELSLVDRAIEIGAQKIQLFKPYFDESDERLQPSRADTKITNLSFVYFGY